MNRHSLMLKAIGMAQPGPYPGTVAAGWKILPLPDEGVSQAIYNRLSQAGARRNEVAARLTQDYEEWTPEHSRGMDRARRRIGHHDSHLFRDVLEATEHWIRQISQDAFFAQNAQPGLRRQMARIVRIHILEPGLEDPGEEKVASILEAGGFPIGETAEPQKITQAIARVAKACNALERMGTLEPMTFRRIRDQLAEYADHKAATLTPGRIPFHQLLPGRARECVETAAAGKNLSGLRIQTGGTGEASALHYHHLSNLAPKGADLNKHVEAIAEELVPWLGPEIRSIDPTLRIDNGRAAIHLSRPDQEAAVKQALEKRGIRSHTVYTGWDEERGQACASMDAETMEKAMADGYALIIRPGTQAMREYDESAKRNGTQTWAPQEAPFENWKPPGEELGEERPNPWAVSAAWIYNVPGGPQEVRIHSSISWDAGTKHFGKRNPYSGYAMTAVDAAQGTAAGLCGAQCTVVRLTGERAENHEHGQNRTTELFQTLCSTRDAEAVLRNGYPEECGLDTAIQPRDRELWTRGRDAYEEAVAKKLEDAQAMDTYTSPPITQAPAPAQAQP